MNVILAVNDKSIEKFIASHKEINVLTSLRKREQIIDRVIELNPHTLVLSKYLSGKLDLREIITRLRELKPNLKIVFLYGSTDSEYRLFTDFLIRNNVYNFIVGGIDEDNLINVVIKSYTLDDVRSFMLSDTEKQEEEKKQKEVVSQQEQLLNEDIKIEESHKEHQLDVLIVEKIIERETIQNKFIGTITINIGSLYSRSGCTHFALCYGAFLKKQKLDFGVVVNETVYNALKSFYMIDKDVLDIKGIQIYNDYIKAKNNHKIVVNDMGFLNETNKDLFYQGTKQIILTPSSAWEIDTLTNFIKQCEYSRFIDYVFFPITDDYFKEIRKNLAYGKYNAYQMNFSNLFEYKNNSKMFDKISENIIKGL